MRAVKIDPVEKTVTEIELATDPNRSLDELQRIIGCELVELVELGEGAIMVVDEEARLKPVRGAFKFVGSRLVIAGTAVILGGDANQFKSLRETKRTFETIIRWLTPEQMPPTRMKLVSLG